MKEKLRNARIVVATHVYATGPAHDLVEYLTNNKTNATLFITHPIFYDPKLSGSGFELYEGNKLIREKKPPIRKAPLLLSYFFDLFATVWWTMSQRDRWDLFVGSNNLNALAGIVLRKFGYVDKVVYYVIDFNPKRFSNKYLNRFYHWLDQYCVEHADVTWNLSPRMEEGRRDFFDFTGGNQVTMPIGIWYDRFPRLPFEEIEPHTLAFMGHILEKHGAQHVIRAIPKIIQSIPDFTFLVIGDGEYLPTLKKLTKQLDIDKHVKFTGFVKDHHDIEKLLVKCAAAVALYDMYEPNGELNFTYYADPGKLKSYLASGLPIITTTVPHNAEAIRDHKCGMIVSTDPEQIAEAVINLMTDTETLKAYRENAAREAARYDWNALFEEQLKKLLSV